MHEDKFEKQVREKMDQLGFDPADAVWSGVSKEINKEKKRRLPLLWLFLFSGLVLVGGGYYVTKNVGNVKNIGNIKDVGNIKNGENIKNVANVKNGDNVKNIERNELKKSNAPHPGRGFVNGEITINQSKIENKKAYRRDIVAINENEMNDHSTNHVETNNGIEKTNNIPAKDPGTDEKLTNRNIISPTGSANVNEANGADKFHGVDSATDKDLISENKIPAKDPATDEKLTDKITIPANDSTTDKKTAANKKQKRWEIGFAGQAGFSNIKQGLFVSNAIGNNPSNANASPGTLPAPATGSPVSDIQDGFSFGISAFANRSLSQRISLSAGLEYHYYSTHVQTGDSVNSATFNIYGPSGLSANYYRNGSGQAYTNSYHFLELPVTVNFQLNKSQKLPVILDAGLSFAYLLKSNALFFDPNTDLYVKSTQSFHKVQLNATSALMFGFHLPHDELRLGPQFQYGITGLTKQGYGAPEHLLYFGMKISFIPRWK
jgi:Outer membrane protein beta-barrel domain